MGTPPLRIVFLLRTVTYKVFGGGVQRFTANGTFTVPANVTKIWITACAGGQKGGSTGSGNYYGGDGGDWIVREPYTVTPGQKLTITIGKGGKTNSEIGGSTVISPLVTLACPGQRGGYGGKGGAYHNDANINGADGYACGGIGKTGTFDSQHGIQLIEYGGGGGSLGRGGGYSQSNGSPIIIAPGYGGGGDGGQTYNGGDGIVIIEW